MNTKRGTPLSVSYPAVASEWHPTLNGGLTAGDVTSSSKDKAWWLCPVGHHYHSIILNRTSKNAGCPYCANRKVWPGFNDLATVNPISAAQWDFSKNEGLKPSEVLFGTTQVVHWLCLEHPDHRWTQSVRERRNLNKHTCPYCSNVLLKEGFNDLASVNPVLASEWHPTKNGSTQPTQVLYGTNASAWWQCKDGHEWEVAVSTRHHQKTQCPTCQNRKVLEGYNDLYSTDRDLVDSQWDYATNYLDPTTLTRADKREVNWHCSEGHFWPQAVYLRVEQNKSFSCPVCSSKVRTSFHEQVILFYLRDLFPDEEVLSGSKVHGEEVDVFVPSLNIAVEYDGYYWHRDKGAKDRDKNRVLKDYRFIRVREKGLEELNDYGCTTIISDPSDEGLKEALYALADILRSEGYTSYTLDVDLERDRKLILSQLAGRVRVGSLASRYPALAAQWHPTKNGSLKPNQVPPYSPLSVYWLCPKGHEHSAIIRNKLQTHKSGGQDCPVCSNLTALAGVNDLATTHFDLAKEWHPTKNGSLSPSSVVAGSGLTVWWQCSSGHEWQDRLVSRKNGNKGCPYCSGARVIKGVSDFPTTHPHVFKEWHTTKNAGLDPHTLSRGSSRKVWWVCSNDPTHEWEAVIAVRTKSEKPRGCPYCKGSRAIPGKTDLATRFPEVASEWDYTANEGLSPTRVTAGSEKVINWVCDKGHKFPALIANRTSTTHQDCPHCPKEVKLHSNLVLDGKVIGVRFLFGKRPFDVGVKDLLSLGVQVNTSTLPSTKLVPYGDSFVSEPEIRMSRQFADGMTDKRFLKALLRGF